MFIVRRHWFFGVALGLLTLARSAQAQFDQLATQVPASANAVVLLDAQKLMASPLAAKEGWKQKYDQAFAAGTLAISPDTERLIIGAEIDFAHMTPVWQVVLADFGSKRSVVDIARRTKGALDTVADIDAVVLSDDSYCVQLTANRLGVFAPANRQTVSRWLRDVSERQKPSLSPYLQATLTAAQTSQIVVAFDLKDALPLAIVRQKLATNAAVTENKIDLDAAAKAVSSLSGVVLEVAITEGSYGRMLVHFGEDASILAPIAKPLVLELLNNQGAMIDDIADWKVTTEPQRFILSGPLSQSGRRRILTLIDHPIAALIAADPSQSQATEPAANKMAIASQQYFKSIMTARDDLRHQSKDAVTMGQTALWLDNWARKIDRLPILNVDPEMLAYGRYITTRMRDSSAALKGVGISSAAREAQVYQQYSGSSEGYGGYYGGGYSYNVQWNNVGGERRAIRAEERAQGASTAQTISAEMDDQTAKVRQVMTQKYQIEF